MWVLEKIFGGSVWDLLEEAAAAIFWGKEDLALWLTSSWSSAVHGPKWTYSRAESCSCNPGHLGLADQLELELN
jgi:hypothetical protein